MTTARRVTQQRPVRRAHLVALIVGSLTLALMCLTASHSPVTAVVSAQPSHGVVAEAPGHDLHQPVPTCETCAEHPEGVWAACVIVMAVALASRIGAPRAPASAQRTPHREAVARIVLPVLSRAPSLHALSVSRT